MSSLQMIIIPSLLRPALLCVAVALTACTPSDSVTRSSIYDPHEGQNREIHEFNKEVDRFLLSPASNGYGSIFPDEIRGLFSNFADHLSLPNDVINNTLQGNLPEAGSTAARFVLNTIFGFAGFVDTVGEFGMPRHDTDFGETLYVWGADEGAYVELPFFGPSTTRDSIGMMVDVIMDPFFVVVREPTRYIGGVAYVVNAMGDRYDYDATIDSILYESADSYAQARILYLQNRRHELGMTSEDSALDPEFDPYEDPYADF